MIDQIFGLGNGLVGAGWWTATGTSCVCELGPGWPFVPLVAGTAGRAFGTVGLAGALGVALGCFGIV